MLRSATFLFLLVLGIGCSAPPAPPSPNQIPVADAGPDQTVAPGVQITLDGSSSTDPDEEDVLIFHWSEGNRNPVSALIPLAPRVRFNLTLSTPGSYWFYLRVSDGQDTSPPDSVRIIVSGTDNLPPVADAGPAELRATSNQIILDGSGSTDPDGDVLSFLWEVVAAPDTVEVVDPTMPQTGFVALASGTYRIRLTVSDGELSAAEEINIEVPASVLTINVPPRADAGPDTLAVVGDLVTLDGSASNDPDGDDDRLTFHWTVGRTPPGVVLTLADSTAMQSAFVPPEPGEYVFGLVVDDSLTSSIRDVVTITVFSQIFEERDGMIEIPAGSFTMGSDKGLDGEAPPHQVELSAFWIDKYEVTAEQYQACVAAGSCAAAGTHETTCNTGRTDRADHPINCVTWEQAQAYCTWTLKRLPTEAEWEKAARGADGRLFPWGDSPSPNSSLLNYDLSNIGTTRPVGSYPNGVSFYGLHDMSGNVLEWTADFFDTNYYAASPAQNPPGPETGNLRVMRSSSFRTGLDARALSTTVRNGQPPNTSNSEIGFRCAR